MRDVFKYNYTPAWKEYYAEKAKGYPYSGSAAFKLNSGRIGFDDRRPEYDKLTEPGAAFLPYWLGLELIAEGKEEALKLTISEILAKCKKDYESRCEREQVFRRKPDVYKGHELNWRMYRPLAMDDSDNSYDVSTEVCVIPFKVSDKEKEELRQMIEEPFNDPYCDGRCTGTWFTGYIGIYTTSKNTHIIHRRRCDC